MPKLIISGTTYELVDDLITIGRGPDNMIVINNPSVSARHAQLQVANETYRLKDLGSTNGTHVNGKPVTETLLRFDDRIRFGAAEARYESDASGSRPLPDLEEIKATPAELSAAPADFVDVSPFRRQKQQSDPVRTGILIGLAIVALVFLGSMIAVLMMHAPSL
ncbi:MAG: FHA domain-containing protein [Verrucomicrobia bacterium]|nr:FHA domain-containing protein [Verrucomicrobiota bacterium]